jgi:hypothetical protein
MNKFNDLANAHAMEVLGEEQFSSNPDAVQSIKTDYMAGANAAFKLLKEFNDVSGNTGISMVATERLSQILIHGITVADDVKQNSEYQLSEAAGMLTPFDMDGVGSEAEDWVPKDWDLGRWEKMWGKPYRERLVIAGALLCAELDRLNAIGATDEGDGIAIKIGGRQTQAEKAAKWDALGKRIAACYVSTEEHGDDTGGVDVPSVGLETVGELAAIAFGYMG